MIDIRRPVCKLHKTADQDVEQSALQQCNSVDVPMNASWLLYSIRHDGRY